ncbi:hypothetical protein HQ587_10755 [bacterium]|nr:hypothetical protein [bacterium]
MKNIKLKALALFLFVLYAICFIAVALCTKAEIIDVFSALKVAYKTIPLVLLLWLGFTLYAWRWCIFHGWLVPFPCLDGTWEGSIQTTWKNPETGEIPGPIPVILTIRQSFTRVSCVMRTAEMTSRSYLGDFWLDIEEQVKKHGYSYTSKPSVLVAERTQPHDGSIVFDIIGKPVEKLHGVYWTTRKTTGEVTLTFRCNKRLEEIPSHMGTHPMSNK